MNRWWIAKDGQPDGPYSVDEIRARLSDGRLTRTSTVCAEGSSTWQALGSIPDFADVATGAPVNVPAAPPPAPPALSAATANGISPSAEDPLGWALVGTPVIAGLLAATFPSATSPLTFTVLAIVVTTILVIIDSRRLGLPAAKHGLATALLWIGGYPLHLHERAKKGAPKRLGLGVLAMAALLFLPGVVAALKSGNEGAGSGGLGFFQQDTKETRTAAAQQALTNFLDAQRRGSDISSYWCDPSQVGTRFNNLVSYAFQGNVWLERESPEQPLPRWVQFPVTIRATNGFGATLTQTWLYWVRRLDDGTWKIFAECAASESSIEICDQSVSVAQMFLRDNADLCGRCCFPATVGAPSNTP